MKLSSKVKVWVRVLCLLVLFDPSLTQAQDASTVSTPASALQSFYHSYLILINDSRDPLRDNLELMNRYVNRRLLTRLERQTSPDEDYFTKSQDVLDDWIDHIAVADRRCPTTDCRLQLTLGLSKSAPYKIDVDMKDTDGSWKITKVTKPDGRR